jgi:hypothetical protein
LTLEDAKMADGMYKEDAERLAEQITDENQMVDIIDIRMDPDRGNYVIIAYDSASDEEIIVDRVEMWNEKKNEIARLHVVDAISVRVHEKHGRKVGSVMGRWVEVDPVDWPGEICDAVEERRVPGEALLDMEPAVAGADIIYPGKGKPDDYGFDGDYLVMLESAGARVYRHIIKLANFTLSDQTGRKEAFSGLGFEINPLPQAPLLEPGAEDGGEKDVAGEVRDRLLDISRQGYGAILLDGQTNVTAYAWVLAGVMGLKVIMAWEQESRGVLSGFSGLGYSELLHYKEIEDTF